MSTTPADEVRSAPDGSDSDDFGDDESDDGDIGVQRDELGELPTSEGAEGQKSPQPPAAPPDSAPSARSKQLVARLKAALARRTSLAKESQASASSNQGSEVRRQSCPGDITAGEVNFSCDKATASSSSPAALAAQWTARLQSQADIRDAMKSCCKRIATQFVPIAPGLLEISGEDYIRLTDSVFKEVEQLQQMLAKAAYKTISTDWEELQALRELANQVEDKMAHMTRTYLQEVAQTRDAMREQHPGLNVAIREVKRQVDYFEPLQYLRPEVRSTCLSILEEKIKAIFTIDSSLQANVTELARFEDSFIKDKLSAYEKMNSKLRDEVRELRANLRKTDSSSERLGWDLAKAHATSRRLTDESEQVTAVSEELREQNRVYRVQAQKATEAAAEARAAAAAAEKRAAAMVAAAESSLQEARAKPQQVDASIQADPSQATHLPPYARSLPRTAPEMFEVASDAEATAEAEEIKTEVGGSGDSRETEEEEELQALKARLARVTAQASTQVKAKATELATVTAEKATLEVKLADLSTRLDAACQELEVSAGVQDELRKQLKSKEEELEQQLPGRSGMECPAGLAVQLEEQIRFRECLQKDFDRVSAGLKKEKAKTQSLEELLAGRRATSNTSNPSRAVHLLEHNEMCKMIDQKARIQEQATVQKAQLDDLLQQNMVLQQSLEEMGKECTRMSDLLQKHLPTHGELPTELSSVLTKMEVMAESGALCHLRLNQDARMRGIAACTRANTVRDLDLGEIDRAAELAPVSPPRRPLPVGTSGTGWPSSTRSQMSAAPGDSSSVGAHVHARTNTQTSIEASFAEAGGVVPRIAGATAPAQQPLPPVKVKGGNKKTSTPRTTTSLDVKEQCANLAVGSRGGFALVGGAASLRRTKTSF
mmetsp:Transcript_137282/g.342256  ORF Transcript_137282/g.342256 Transcript_137282/m.342256 type:complete len:888 (+) Transcript_137282:146-2809(+)|eukprot:CAMPEP_0115220220 /NCGR_PEP_ID=MMETSP0270-20121206/27333_1 /TAXON_ID=71861 /ORGANISM="Scrippsiella trochoidea, Strain CCMP3099" /LENGTH=887 /DNA_ID=CAMNT_0002634265 /DNA_START=79 /DNA_END=2742 /DNA_ORIENTATION=-